MKSRRRPRHHVPYQRWSCDKLQREWFRLVEYMRRKGCQVPVLDLGDDDTDLEIPD